MSSTTRRIREPSPPARYGILNALQQRSAPDTALKALPAHIISPHGRRMVMSHSDDAAALRQQGHRLTPQRLMVLEIVKRSGKHLTAEDVHAAILPQHPY